MSTLTKNQIKELLDTKALQYNQVSFIQDDPIQIPHLFSQKEDIEIAGFLAATIAWGQRKTIINNAKLLMEKMDFAPHQFILTHQKKDLEVFKNFKHRTFNFLDLSFFLKSLQNIYLNHGGLETLFSSTHTNYERIVHFRSTFEEIGNIGRTAKHVSNPAKGSSAKRLNMFLRWMVRNDNQGVDFGIWKKINPATLLCPLDVHTGNVARKLGILTRTQNDWKSVMELSKNLASFDKKDPIKYDFALFGLGAYEKF